MNTVRRRSTEPKPTGLASHLNSGLASSPRRSLLASRPLLAGLLLATYAMPIFVPRTLGGEVGFIEDFALAKNRAAALDQLIPGTDDYYYFHCLNHQHLEQFDKVEKLLPTWVKRHGENARVREIRHRQALLTYNADPEASLAYLKRHFGLQFQHQRAQLNSKRNLPTKLDPSLISLEKFYQRAISRTESLNGFKLTGLTQIAEKDLTPNRRRQLLAKLQRPDFPNLVQLIHDDLQYKNSSGFGSLPIHRALLKSQLDELLQLEPTLRSQQAFVQTYLSKLRPSNDVNLKTNSAAQLAHLERLEAFVSTLAPQHNSLKAHVLYHRLVFDRSRGVYSKERFLEYLKLPRNAAHVSRDYLNRVNFRGVRANLEQDFTELTARRPIGSDEELVSSYLMHFFKTETDRKPYETYLNSEYLKHLYAETKILNGLGDAEQWASLLPPEKFQALRERVDLKFSYQNKQDFAADDRVSLDLDVKNVKSLIVKVFEINTESWYRKTLSELDTNINLDGLVPNQEFTLTYDESPLRRIRRHFDFPKLKSRGIYVIDFIGNGQSSRAVVRKGRLHYLIRKTAAGHLFTILNEQHQPVAGASLWLAGHQYQANKAGELIVPFSTKPGRQAIVLSDGELSSLAHFEHDAEVYSLQAGFHLERESLLARRAATLAIRPRLMLGQNPVPFDTLESVSLTIQSTTIDGTQSSQRFQGKQLALSATDETLIEFQVPARLQTLTATLSARVKNLTTGQTENVSSSQSFEMNQILKTATIQDLFLTRSGEDYLVELLGRTGEALAARPVQFTFHHRDFNDAISLSLQTDDSGRIVLGPLKNIISIRAAAPQRTQTWILPADQSTLPSVRHAIVGTPIYVSLPPNLPALSPSEVSLFEVRGGTYVANHFDKLAIRSGLLEASKLPAGDYELRFKRAGRSVTLRLTEGKYEDGYVVGEHRRLQVINPLPLQMQQATVEDKSLQVRVFNAGKTTRLHVIATRYQPSWRAFDQLSRVATPEPGWLTVPYAHAAYVEGRNIGEEYRYIIERRYARKFPGNMLERPSWLLNPWAVRDTQTTSRDATKGNDFGGVGGSGGGLGGMAKPTPRESQGLTDFSNLDFLPGGAFVLWNLKPDKQGLLKISRKELEPFAQVQLVVVDAATVQSQIVSLPAKEEAFKDLRLKETLDTRQQFAMRKQVSVIQPGETFQLDHIETAEFEAYDTLRSLFNFYGTVSPSQDWEKFRFLVDWPTLNRQAKLEKFNEFTCHEVNFFLYQKDPEFFQQTVLPYLQNKMAKTFLDLWLVNADLSDFLSPWAYRQLNPVERVLLAQRIQNEQQYTVEHLVNLHELQQQNRGRTEQLFETAVRFSSLHRDSGINFSKAKDQRLRELESRLGATRQSGSRDKNSNGSVSGKAGEPTSAPQAPGFGPGDGQAEKKNSSRRPDSADDSKPGADYGRKRDLSRDELKRMTKQYQSSESDMELSLGYLGDDLSDEKLRLFNRGKQTQFFRKLDTTKEWIENHYWHTPLADCGPELLSVNQFWVDYARHKQGTPFFSTHVAEATGNLHEMLLALAVVDLPFSAEEHQIKFADSRMTLQPASPVIVFHEQIKAAKASNETPILVSQNFYRQDDPYETRNGQRLDKYVSQEFLVHTVYGGKLVVTNPTSAEQKLSLLVQIPAGAIPVNGSKALNNVSLTLPAYQTKTYEYAFYFPIAGEYEHYPAQVSKEEVVIASAKPQTFRVVNEPSKIDRESWAYLSQFGEDADVLKYLRTRNIESIDLSRVAFRMRDVKFYRQAIEVLTRRHARNAVLLSYGLYHKDPSTIAEYLAGRNDFIEQTGRWISSPLLTIDPTARRTYEHRDYAPLVKARSHRLGQEHEILNDRFSAHYQEFLKLLSYRRSLTDSDRLAVVYYMLLQNRIGTALDFFSEVNVDTVPMRLQYDYCAAYLAMYQGDVDLASQLARGYLNHPVARWRNRFAAVHAQVQEIRGADLNIVDEDNREQQQTLAAADSPEVDLKIEGDSVVVNYANVKSAEVRYYLMDVELLFSRNPFVQAGTDRFMFIKPNQSQIVKLPGGQSVAKFKIPAELKTKNLLVQITAEGQSASAAYYSNSFNVNVSENYGQLLVQNSKTQRAEPRVYVKVYARMSDGQVRFYKDGYTDLRGRFDYVSLSTNELENVSQFAVLVLSEKHGAIVKEVRPPKR